METWIGVVIAVVTSGVLTAIVSLFQNKRINNATANNLSADYTRSILSQAEDRVRHALDDRNRALEERDDAREDAKGQRKAKQGHRENFLAEQKAHHSTQLMLKDSLAKISESDWHRCEINGCNKRTPPRKREE